jgi:hypothetical protein
VRLFQNSALGVAYLPRLRSLSASCNTFADHVRVFLDDRFAACHFLLPVLERDQAAFFTNGNDELVQRAWAAEHGLHRKATLTEILLAQIEEHRTDVLYNLDPVRYGNDFVARLPGCVKRSIAWRAAPSGRSDFSAYGRIVCNFPGILDAYRKAGWNAAYFAPAHDPMMDRYAENTVRPVDVMFIGGYSRHHRRRAELLEAVAGQLASHSVEMHLDRSRATRWAESPIGRLLPLGAHRRPSAIRHVSRPPVFGLALYETLSRAKIVINGAVDMAGDDRGNMRCFEAMGCGCALLSDAGNYPAGMVNSESLRTYTSSADAVETAKELLAADARRESLAVAGHAMVSTRYSKQNQWIDFQALAA